MFWNAKSTEVPMIKNYKRFKYLSNINEQAFVLQNLVFTLSQSRIPLMLSFNWLSIDTRIMFFIVILLNKILRIQNPDTCF